ncbi:MAG: PQQ-binding-like beta-propeller repeat protein [Phycisphaerae bacterium]|nr:PQQ-binding-like beta-propeller repeat protein [Phycisphaerae bacterium]
MKRIALTIPVFLVTVICHAGMVEASDLRGGIVVHLNCGEGKTTAEMTSGNDCLIHGLDKDAGKISKAREYLRSKNLYGRVSVARYDGKSLPYGDNLINLLIADSLGDVPLSEVMRVLVPKGAVIVDGKKTIKPWPKEIDTWPQYLNKADNNAVAMDSVVGPPRRIQWLDTPTWSRSHMGISTFVSAVTCNGRLFSIEDRSLPDNPFLPGRFMFVARDAFNGRTLWTRKIERWESITVYIKCLPTQQQRRMVATEDVLYCTPVLEGPLAALDAATGKTLKTYDGISPVQEVAYDQGILFVNVGERFNAGAYNQTSKKSSGKRGTPGEPFHGGGFRKGYAPETKDKEMPVSVIVAIDAKTGRQLWKTKSLKNYTGASLAVKGNRAVYQTGEGMFCINPRTGKALWSVKKTITNAKGHDSHTPGTMPNTVIITDDKAFAAEGDKLFAYSLEDGKTLWDISIASNYQASPDLFHVDGTVWIGGTRVATGHDADPGKEIKSLIQKVTGPMGHDRCYRNLITKKYFINSKTGGADFLDLETGGEFPHHWTRGACGMGVLPANGLLYSTPYSCTCSVGDMMEGINAYSADPELLKSNDSGLIKREVRREKGPAYGKVGSGKDATPDEWPTYRGNNFRGGMTNSKIATKLKIKWQVKLPGNPTASTIAGGKVYVCTPETHTLHALDSSSGKTTWTFTADGRIDSPPTYHKGMVLFGSRDGWLYCLRASDGELSWRFKDLPDRLVGAFGQLESAWPISGSVLVLDDKVYAAAGRSSFLDGGIFLYCLDPATGRLLKSRSVFGPFAKRSGFPVSFKATARKGNKKAAPIMLGFKNDVFVSDGKNLYLRHAAFDKDLADSPTTNKRLMPLGGFLDRRVQHRTGFILNRQYQWWRNDPKDIMISDGRDTYAITGFRSSHNHAYFDPRTSAYTLKGKNAKAALPINGRALAKAGEVIFVAGEPMKFKDPTWRNYVDAYNGKLGGSLLALSAADGKEILRYKLPAAPVWDSIAIARGRLYISLADGTVQCMGR